MTTPDGKSTQEGTPSPVGEREQDTTRDPAVRPVARHNKYIAVPNRVDPQIPFSPAQWWHGRELLAEVQGAGRRFTVRLYPRGCAGYGPTVREAYRMACRQQRLAAYDVAGLLRLLAEQYRAGFQMRDELKRQRGVIASLELQNTSLHSCLTHTEYALANSRRNATRLAEHIARGNSKVIQSSPETA